MITSLKIIKYLGEINIKGGEFSYKCFAISRDKVMDLYADIISTNKQLAANVTIQSFTLRPYWIRVQKIQKNKIVGEIEYLCGTTYFSTKEAFNILSKEKVDIEDIETLLELNNFPRQRQFDEVIESSVYRRLRKQQTMISQNITKYKKMYRIDTNFNINSIAK